MRSFNRTWRFNRVWRRYGAVLSGVAYVVAGVAASVSIGGCHRDAGGAPPAAATSAEGGKEAAGKEAGEGVSLTPGEIDKMGIVTADLTAVMHSPEASGFGVVMSHEAIAQAVAELATAEAIARQSRAAYERIQKLAGTPGAMPAETQEATQRQAIVDEASLELVKRRLSSTFGQNPPWQSRDGSAQLAALARGDSKLVRVTFPLGALSDSNPATLRFTHLGTARGGKSWQSRSVWNAPGDATMPGKSVFAVLQGSDVGEGERLLAWAPVGAAEPGVLIPSAATIISDGKYWCYVEKKPGTFVRTELDTGMPTADGYFMTHGVAVGEKVVAASAGQLLARETNPSSTAE